MSTVPSWTRALAFLVLGAAPAPVLAELGETAVHQHRGTAALRFSLLDSPARLSIRNVPLARGLEQLHETSGVNLVFSPSLLPKSRTVTCRCETVSVGKALDEMLAGIRVRYFEQDGHVVVSPPLDPQLSTVSAAFDLAMDAGPPTLVLSSDILTPPAAAVGTVTGLVTSAGRERPLAGAQVLVVGTGIGGVTNNQGRYLLANVPDGEATVRVELIGYAMSEATVTIRPGETAVLDLELQERAIALDEVVATGTAQATERRKLGNTLAVLDAAKVAELAPIRDFTELLQGRSAAVTVLPTTGTVGTGASIRMRGITSVSQTNKPLIYIDGVRADDSSLALSVGGASPTRLTDINPHDIERVEMVKGAAATTLYGTAASNGVVQIFTKRGRTGPARWSALIEQGAERLSTDRMPGRLWTQFEGPSGFRAHDPKDIVRTGHIQNYQLSVGGGAEVLSYYVSGGYQRQEGSVTPDVNFMNQAFARVNLNAVLHPTLSVAVNTGYVNSELRLPDNDNALHGVYSQVVSGIPYTADEGRPWGERWGSHEINKTIETFQHINRFTSGIRVDHQPLSFLKHSFNVGLDWYGQLDEKFYPYGFQGSGNNLGSKNSRQRTVANTSLDYRAALSYLIRPDITSELAAGFQGNFDRDHRTQSSGVDYPAPGLRTVGATTITEGTETWIHETNAGFFSQLSLGLFDKIFFTGGVRFDGNSAFGEDFPFQAYPKASVAYSISDESFWPKSIASTMKLRAAYGTSGRAPAQFSADRTFSPIASEDGEPAVTPWNVGDPDLGPETSREIEVGFDAGLLNDRVGVEFTYFDQVTQDALVYKRFPPSMGFDRTQLANIGELKNWGWEIGVRGLILTGDAVNWEANLQLSTGGNEVTSLGGEPSFSGGNGTRVVEGYPATGKWTRVIDHWDPVARRHIGVDTMVYRGDATPEWRGSLTSHVRLFNNLTVSGMAEWATGMIGINFARGWAIGKLTGDEYLALLEKPTGNRTAAADSLLDMWNVITNSGWVEKADWLKIREVSLTYQLPDSWVAPARLRDTSIRLSGRNLYLWAPHWSGPDPEVKYGGNEGDLNIGYDFNTMPIPRRFTVSIRTGW
jgi:TonB-dependent SusC/RagA subfamily outer membrane receptor